MCKAIKFRQEQNTAKTKPTTTSVSTVAGDVEGQTLGFGKYKNLSRFDLFNSTQPEHKNYVESVLKTPVTYPGGQFEKLKNYIQAQKKMPPLYKDHGDRKKTSRG